jgi:urease gamma subunit
MRVGQKQKKIDINIPKLDDFIHKVYINVARKVYKNVYLFEVSIQPLQIQKNYRELEIIIQECILNTLRESIPVEAILKAYMDESTEEDVIEEVKEEVTHEPIKAPVADGNIIGGNNQVSDELSQKGISFNDIDYIKTDDGISHISAPKSIERLEEISVMRNEQRKREQEDEDDNIKLTISEQPFSLDNIDVHNIDEPKLDLLPDLLIDEIEILE